MDINDIYKVISTDTTEVKLKKTESKMYHSLLMLIALKY